MGRERERESLFRCRNNLITKGRGRMHEKESEEKERKEGRRRNRRRRIGKA